MAIRVYYMYDCWSSVFPEATYHNSDSQSSIYLILSSDTALGQVADHDAQGLSQSCLLREFTTG